MKRPTKAKVGPFSFRIDYNNDELLDHSEADGLFQGSKLTITIRSDIAEPVQRSALLHELLHGCVFYGDESEVKDEESAVTLITVPLLALLRDNPALTVWLLED